MSQYCCCTYNICFDEKKICFSNIVPPKEVICPEKVIAPLGYVNATIKCTIVANPLILGWSKFTMHDEEPTQEEFPEDIRQYAGVT